MSTAGTDQPKLQTSAIPDPAVTAPSAAKVLHGRLIPPQQQILLYSSAEWEAFIQEWVHHQKKLYAKVVRLTGAGDMGIDIAGLTDAAGFFGAWDNFQCKHYDDPLQPNIAIPEIGKMLFHSFRKEFRPPRRYFFVAPKECGMALTRMLLDPTALRARVLEKWDDWCATSITSKEVIVLDGEFRTYVENFDYSIFSAKTLLEIIDDHRTTPYFVPRFGGGLPDRPSVDTPPTQPSAAESRYLQQLFEAYGDHKHSAVSCLDELAPWQDLIAHYHRQREFFYHAEALRNFARDTVPAGTFEDLQDEVHAGVVEVEAAQHSDGFARLNAVAHTAAMLPLTANGLISVTKIQDKRGICHQLAIVDRLRWRKP